MNTFVKKYIEERLAAILICMLTIGLITSYYSDWTGSVLVLYIIVVLQRALSGGDQEKED